MTTFVLSSEENILDPKTAFISIALFNLMRIPLSQMPGVIAMSIQANVSLKRVSRFLDMTELDPEAVCSDGNHSSSGSPRWGIYMGDEEEEREWLEENEDEYDEEDEEYDDYDEEYDDYDEWDEEEEDEEEWDEEEEDVEEEWSLFDEDVEEGWRLEGVEMEVLRGQLVGVVGPVGSGKSSLLAALLGEMNKTSGTVIVNGSVGYASQQVWLQNATLRENIIWGLPYQPYKYQKVLEACALKADLDMLPAGDLTEVGEKVSVYEGMNLSGGQKQRISLARVAYSGVDVVLLDDPLSAVDTHVGKHIFKHLIGPGGLLNDKTRLLVTHAVWPLDEMDQVVVVSEGCVVECGTFDELVQLEGHLSSLIHHHHHNTQHENDNIGELYDHMNTKGGGQLFTHRCPRDDEDSIVGSLSTLREQQPQEQQDDKSVNGKCISSPRRLSVQQDESRRGRRKSSSRKLSVQQDESVNGKLSVQQDESRRGRRKSSSRKLSVQQDESMKGKNTSSSRRLSVQQDESVKGRRKSSSRKLSVQQDESVKGKHTSSSSSSRRLSVQQDESMRGRRKSSSRKLSVQQDESMRGRRKSSSKRLSVQQDESFNGKCISSPRKLSVQQDESRRGRRKSSSRRLSVQQDESVKGRRKSSSRKLSGQQDESVNGKCISSPRKLSVQQDESRRGRRKSSSRRLPTLMLPPRKSSLVVALTPQKMSMLQQKYKEALQQQQQNKRRLSSVTSLDGDGDGFLWLESYDKQQTEAEMGILVQEEKAETGKVKFGVYRDYSRAMGYLRTVLPLLFFIIGQGCQAGSNVWLSLYTAESEQQQQQQQHHQNNSINVTTPNFDRTLFLIGYGGFGTSQAVFFYIGSLLMWVGCLRAGRGLHNSLLHSILRLPMSFFDTNPSGRIMNRFGKEMDALDSILPMFLSGFHSCFSQVFIILVVIIGSTPIVALVLLPVLVIYVFMLVVYVTSSRQIKRIESVFISPIYTHFTESIQGVTTIRAFKKQAEFTKASLSKVEDAFRALYALAVCNRWLGVRLELIGNLIIFAAAVFAVAGRDSLNPSIVGLSVSYALNITVVLNYLVRMSAEVEANIVAVERVKEYIEESQEAPWEKEPSPPTTWPNMGSLTFNHYHTRYRPGLPLAIKDLHCHIAPAEKVGIVGRTGAGKSSLALALLRVIEAAGGTITLDGLDISTLGLHQLRSRITIIPQDPVLFGGTLRQNLDPGKVHNDADVWHALELAHLAPYVRSLPLALMAPVDNGGAIFSVGQKQLVSLARALLRKTRLLVLDEATAAVDIQTDTLIQSTIRAEFTHCTVLTIAHRLNTIMDSDRVLVMDQGRIAEMDSPSALLANKNSIFYSMAKDAGLVTM
ncbi:hypothetical protein Pcinc_027341 [Petrolisthes cinctipes]|uniref:ABC-type glutathione-S-conjugate transporter n=1 Tax=Petrolisthes cinctipes TaxID=88211 RepID=A0AAE1K8R8_PETCI|nr:hypothetical protein Pcinc_027341 [Petrolisthes cinctipes]